MVYLRPSALVEQAHALDWPALFEERARSARDYRLQRFYRAGLPAPDTPLAQVPFVAMDFETTGLDVKKDAIVSIGLVPFSLQRIRCKEAAHWIVNPHKPMVEETVVLHHITHSEVKEAPDLLLVLDDLLAALAGRVVVVHYRRIEQVFFAAALKARLNEDIRFPVIDTMELETRFHPRRLNLWDRLRRRKPASIRLANSRERYHLPYYAPHHALTDALATAELLQAQVAHHYTPETPLSELWL
ncbi:3'-5' exonuclease [Oceanimonas sp. CHS3-5]|uniref:3'-5' exonuclease n=1 Tax=Oceanimonas sp. CHS3-5 TaxID=3068186 RepID=UPI00273D95E6|nr:3'-5' exonuclease [Oceanimonas sp. CHS3-5]MDP5290764.1 3'-5' exonuclease [Oceanimonas sp. CHS3-5]